MAFPLGERGCTVAHEALVVGHASATAVGQHLDPYLAEFCFRYNHRHTKNRGLIFYRLIEAALTCPRTAFRGITR